MRIDIGTTDHEIDGAAKGVGYLPSAGKRYAALGAVSGALVSSIGGCGDADTLCELLGGAKPRFAAQPLECSFPAYML